MALLDETNARDYHASKTSAARPRYRGGSRIRGDRRRFGVRRVVRGRFHPLLGSRARRPDKAPRSERAQRLAPVLLIDGVSRRRRRGRVAVGRDGDRPVSFRRRSDRSDGGAMQAAFVAIALGPAILIWLAATAVGEAARAGKVADELARIARDAILPLKRPEEAVKRVTLQVRREIAELHPPSTAPMHASQLPKRRLRSMPCCSRRRSAMR